MSKPLFILMTVNSQVQTLPNSSVEILELFLKYQKLTVAEIIKLLKKEIIAQDSRIKYGVRVLLKLNLIVSEPNLNDMRNPFYKISDPKKYVKAIMNLPKELQFHLLNIYETNQNLV
jgi:hypothetical protein